ncbi:MAG TPA: S8 family serine peptidase [Flavobacterium sp.]|jgi:hypothetical protein
MRTLLLFALLLVGATSFAQQDAWVYFNAKPNPQFFLSNPLEMLTQRAIDRRTTQNIALDILDVPLSQTYIDQVEAASGITVLAKSKWLNAVHVRGSIFAINALENLEIVDHVDFADNNLDGAGRVADGSSSSRNQDAQAVFPYGQSANQIEMLNGHLLHQQNYTGTGKVIAVLDAGFPGVDVVQPFQRLWTNNKILGGYNFADRNTNIFTRSSHGTMVLSTMGGYTENQLVGTAPDASYYLFITEMTESENPLEESLWVEAAEMADSLGVDVINTSLGYFEYDDPDYSYSYADLDGVTAFVSRGADIAFSRGMVVVVSAGNSGGTVNPHISVPADAVNVLTVGSVNSAGVYSAFSSTGPTSDGRVKPDVMARGQAAVVANPNGNITTASGTSFAGPIMAGMVASLWQALPDKTNAEIIQMIKESAHLYATPNAQYGYGIPDFSEALDSFLLIEDFTLFPNPATSFFSIAFPSDIFSADVIVYSLSGQKVVEQQGVQHASQVGLEKLSPGLYIYKIQSGSRIATGKFIKQ